MPLFDSFKKENTSYRPLLRKKTLEFKSRERSILAINTLNRFIMPQKNRAALRYMKSQMKA